MRIGGFIAKLSCEMVLLKHKFLGGKKLMKNFRKSLLELLKKVQSPHLKEMQTPQHALLFTSRKLRNL